MRTFRLIRSRPASAVYNMALDEKIFFRFMKDGIPVFRIYSWQSPSFTYGVSQKNPGREIVLSQCAKDGVYLAKRMTGGGILFHNDEITYSLSCSKEDVGEKKEVFVSYRNICAFLISFYRALGLDPSFALERKDFNKHCAAHPLCSASREKYDIVINGKKIGGNAQRRNKQAIFQHGSIPISIDFDLMSRYIRFLPKEVYIETTSLSRELKRMPARGILEEKLIEAVKDSFGINFIEEEEPVHEALMA